MFLLTVSSSLLCLIDLWHKGWYNRRNIGKKMFYTEWKAIFSNFKSFEEHWPIPV